MKCIRCSKPLKTAAVTVGTKDGPAYFGPKCARVAFAMPRKTRVPKPAIPLVEVDPRQMALELEAV